MLAQSVASTVDQYKRMTLLWADNVPIEVRGDGSLRMAGIDYSYSAESMQKLRQLFNISIETPEDVEIFMPDRHLQVMSAYLSMNKLTILHSEKYIIDIGIGLTIPFPMDCFAYTADKAMTRVGNSLQTHWLPSWGLHFRGTKPWKEFTWPGDVKVFMTNEYTAALYPSTNSFPWLTVTTMVNDGNVAYGFTLPGLFSQTFPYDDIAFLESTKNLTGFVTDMTEYYRAKGEKFSPILALDIEDAMSNEEYFKRGTDTINKAAGVYISNDDMCNLILLLRQYKVSGYHVDALWREVITKKNVSVYRLAKFVHSLIPAGNGAIGRHTHTVLAGEVLSSGLNHFTNIKERIHYY